ncbi:DUF309 domain-containing protein [Halalkalicoccus ordinarius]|uniref:DUF309 domain-containing protein n=1 Tax=Halalkalicoccus ordinarius TaxID=3116651 RepID=UPI00300E7511
MEKVLQAGVAVYNAGEHHAAHDVWEERWLELESGTDDERLLHGLIQFTAAVHHARNRNWVGATGLAESAREYLEGLPEDYHGIALAPVRGYLAGLAADPERIERGSPPMLTHAGVAVTPEDLDAEATFTAARALAEAFGLDDEVIGRAIGYAREELEESGRGPFLALVFDLVREERHRGLVTRRLEERVARRRSRERDVEGLFDPGE